MNTMKIRDLTLHLNDTEGATSDDDAGVRSERAVRHAREFIETFERSTCRSIAPEQRRPIADHLWNAHVDGDSCANCPYFEALAPWRAILATTSLWLAWAERERKRPDRRAIWSAFKTLSTYLSLQAEGLRKGTRFSLREANGRRQLKDGNNRVRLLAAMDRGELEVEVSESCGPTPMSPPPVNR